MKNLKHTQGEWIVGIDNNIYSQNGDVKISVVQKDFNISQNEAEANAKLISATPDLLKALILIINDDPTFLEIPLVLKAIEKATK